MCAWILRWICGRPVILSLDFSLLGSGVRKWSVQPWAFLMYVENLEMNNSLRVFIQYQQYWFPRGCAEGPRRTPRPSHCHGLESFSQDSHVALILKKVKCHPPYQKWIY